MKINYNVKGKERKELVTAIGQELNASIKYLGIPTAAYEVGGYTIDRNGTVTGEDNRELVDDIFILHSFKAESEEYDTPLPETEEAPAFESLTMNAEEELGLGRQRRDYPGEDGMQASDVPEPDYDEETPDIDQHHPGRYADPNEPPTEEMLRQAAAWMEGQPEYEYESHHYRVELSDPGCMGEQFAKRTTSPGSPERMEVFTADNDEDALRQAFEYATGGVVLLELHELDEDYNEVRTVDIPRRADRLAIEMPKTGFTETAIANLRRLVESKTALIQKAVGADSLPIEETGNTMRFPWFSPDASADEVNAYSHLIAALCKMAKKQKRITAKEKSVDNEKYAFRCFLIRLGFIGDEFKDTRKVLLANLEGNGSFRQPAVRTEADASEDGMHEMFDEVYTPQENIGALTTPDIKIAI